IKYSESFYNFLAKIFPQKWLDAISRYSSSTEGITTLSDWKVLLRSYIINTITHSVIIIAIIVLASRYLHPFIENNITNGKNGVVISVSISFLIMAPFLWALAVRRIEKTAYSHL